MKSKQNKERIACDLGVQNDSLHATPKSQVTKEKLVKWAS
jgi:hypothetical protein